MPTLILTPRFTEDSQELWRAAVELGWKVERLTSWRVPEYLQNADEPVLYLEALFGPVLAEQFGMRLLEPDADWLSSLPEEFRKRQVSLMTLGAARELTEPAFIKPPNDKSFPARIYRGTDLPAEFDANSLVLVAEIVEWESEFRCFVLDRELRAISIYLRSGELQRENNFTASDSEFGAAKSFLQSVLADPRIALPRATVLDVGFIKDRGWAVIEQNAAWGSGIYGCDPKQVLGVLRYAAVPI